ncbi:MAG: exosortase A [Pseudomonadota bacterium]|nr:exosortase A [Pseudomonadota bacterium]
MSAQTPQETTRHSSVMLEQQNLKLAALLTLAAVTAILIGYHKTTWSMVSIWERSDTFAHGFLILPFSAYLIWGQRKHLSTLFPQPNPLALLALGGLGFSWLLATLASVQVFEQFLLITMIPAVVWAILGNRMVWALAFPLAYLWLAVPFGEALIPPLIDFTADFTVTALQLTGIPVYREGAFFTIPSGNWSVVEACSGLRYLIASFTLGTLYAYLTYRSLGRRLTFIALSLIVPIIANGIRAYMIVMTGHLSDMRLAVGVDHLIYGWIFFGFVMLLLFWIGSFWREDGNEYDGVKAGPQHEPSLKPDGKVSPKSPIFIAGAVLAIALIWPAYAAYLENMASHSAEQEIEIPVVSEKWQIIPGQVSDWEPTYVGAAAQLRQHYRNGGRSVDLYISYYRDQQQGTELINSGNVLVPEMGSHWYNVKEGTRRISLGSQQETVNQNQLHSSSAKLLVWRWYWLGEEKTANPYLAKFILAKNKLLRRGDDGAEIIIATRYEEVPDEAVPILQGFLGDMMPAITIGLQNAGNR